MVSDIYPPQVETALNDHPAVIRSAVIGRSSGNADEEILDFVRCAEPEVLSSGELAAFVAERLVSYKRSSRIIMITELPAAATGKVLKHRLLSTFAGQLIQDDLEA